MYGEIIHTFRNKMYDSEYLDICFIIKLWECISRDEHLQSYKLQETKKYELITYQSLIFLQPRNKICDIVNNSYILYDIFMY